MIEPLAVVYAALAGAGATAIGASGVLILPKLSHRSHDTFLGFSTGLMGGIVGLQLLPEAFRTSQGRSSIALLGFLLGVIVLIGLDRAVRWAPTPEPFRRGVSGTRRAPTGFLVFLALSVHNAPEGRGDGPIGLHTRPPAANFHRPESRNKSDEDLLKAIRQGHSETAMASWKGALSEEKQRDVLAYIRKLSIRKLSGGPGRAPGECC